MTATRRVPSGPNRMTVTATLPWWRKPAVIGGAAVALAAIVGGVYFALKGRGPASSQNPLGRFLIAIETIRRNRHRDWLLGGVHRLPHGIDGQRHSKAEEMATERCGFGMAK